eukprot:CAMPEP_0194120290 /NCGR_PEP_ID=MMETSP0150-20130528/42887_1 /TAXON_ID=122233 /ORGANISM="Chaetoceros debilis, Strain MM31A-1" /LENGTH=578 /DNA_ID=CAMNT_0038812341 /DNA_START=119 /DNA_END=1855 /DNA_ORIENTATION=+
MSDATSGREDKRIYTKLPKIEVKSDVDSIQKFLNQLEASTHVGSTLSLVLLHGTWNKNLNLLNSSSLEKLMLTFEEAIHNVPNVQDSFKQIIPFQVDRNLDTIDFCVSDDPSDEVMKTNIGTQIGGTYREGKTNMNGRFHIKAPAELPALILMNCCKVDNAGIEEIIHISASSYDISRLMLDRKMHKAQLQLSKDVLRKSIVSALKKVKKTDFHPSITNRINLKRRIEDEKQIRIFIAGDRSQCGKSSVCLGILGTLLQKLNYPASSLAYIKPATQCEETQLVTEFCKRNNIDACPVGPIVYYRGFTRAYLNGETETSEQLLEKVSRAVDDIGKGKDVVIIDGVGYPSVGSITGTDNASVAIASGYSLINPLEKRPPGVLIVGKRGVGDAVDSYNLNASYFRSKANSVPVLGAIFNRLPSDGYYSLENCKEAVSMYFNRHRLSDSKPSNSGRERVFGFIPEVEGIADSRKKQTDGADISIDNEVDLAMSHADRFIQNFSDHVDVAGIIERAASIRDAHCGSTNEPHMKKARTIAPGGPISSKETKCINNDKLNNSVTAISLTRDQIEKAAKMKGAGGG